MQINWKLRFKNKTILTALIAAVVAFVYNVLGLIGIVPAISESAILQAASMAVNILVLLGIVVDPTTSGVEDSAKAMQYDAPR